MSNPANLTDARCASGTLTMHIRCLNDAHLRPIRTWRLPHVHGVAPSYGEPRPFPSRRAETARASSQVTRRPSLRGAARVSVSSGLQAACRSDPDDPPRLFPAHLGRWTARVSVSSGLQAACRNGSSEISGVFGESDVRLWLERTLERARRPVVRIPRRPSCALLPSLHAFPLARARLARCFSKIGPKARSAHICTVFLRR